MQSLGHSPGIPVGISAGISAGIPNVVRLFALICGLAVAGCSGGSGAGDGGAKEPVSQPPASESPASDSGDGARIGQSASSATGREPDQTSGSPAVSSSAGGDKASPPPIGKPSGQVSERECEAWLDRFLSMAQRDHDATVDPRYRPTPEQLKEIRIKLGPQLMQACLQLDRATYDCEMRAADRDALMACSAKKRKP